MAGVNEWDNEYARLARAASQLRTQGLITSGGGGGLGDQQRSLQQGLSRLEAELNTLPLPPAETQRRRRLVQHLQQSGSSAPNSTVGSSLDGSGAGGSGSGSNSAVPQSAMAMAMRVSSLRGVR